MHHYKLEYKCITEKAWSATFLSVGDCDCTLEIVPLPADTNVQVRLSAQNAFGYGSASEASIFTTRPLQPDCPTELETTKSAETCITLRWFPPPCNASEIISYRVFFMAVNSFASFSAWSRVEPDVHQGAGQGTGHIVEYTQSACATSGSLISVKYHTKL